MTRISFLFVEMDFPGGRRSSGKIVEFPGGGGEYGQTLWNGKSRGVGGQTGKTLRGGVWIFSGTTHFNYSKIKKSFLPFIGKFVMFILAFDCFYFLISVTN